MVFLAEEWGTVPLREHANQAKDGICCIGRHSVEFFSKADLQLQDLSPPCTVPEGSEAASQLRFCAALLKQSHSSAKAAQDLNNAPPARNVIR